MWATLPVGRVGRVAVRLRVGESGALEDVSIEEPDSQGEVLQRIIERTVLLLRAGTFSLDPRKLQNGTERLSLEVRVAQRPPNPDDSSLPQHLYAQGHEAPTAERPGYARVTLNSGLTLDITLRLEPTGLPTR